MACTVDTGGFEPAEQQMAHLLSSGLLPIDSCPAMHAAPGTIGRSLTGVTCFLCIYNHFHSRTGILHAQRGGSEFPLRHKVCKLTAELTAA